MTMGLIPNIRQNGYVVRDIDEAMDFWARAYGVRPFRVLRRIRPQQMVYRGQEVQPELSIALAYAGDFQIELIEQHDDVPSLYRDFIARAGCGLQHVGALTERYDDELARLRSASGEPVQTGVTLGGARYAYFDRGGGPGTCFELIELSPVLAGFFASIATACRNAGPGTPFAHEWPPKGEGT